ncbi:hypothetical protein M2163_005568 [Streptomyces sp. SAI-135]|uniref:hypothetical protein n=1 Tax=unclassified Streptomyces TaxID=2593676 RepID=UPI00247429C0|nr:MULTISPECIES: hypothetical protein [unclassified Streptomyces]MDH6517451.1 hypothetical protein [Streptomyces sp. SAI-090]MDH6618460.1 hypothetical protein [Streptomyces sp. SAI-135]
MTSAIFSRTVPVRRAGLAAAGLVGALVLTACSGGGSDDDASPSASASVPPSASASPSSAASGGTSSSASGEVAGSWLATTGGKAVALLVNGDQAGLFATGGTVCSGSASATAIRLKCADGNTDRGEGTVEAVGRTTLKVKWSGSVGTETYTRAEGGRLPSGLPTAELGS